MYTFSLPLSISSKNDANVTVFSFPVCYCSIQSCRIMIIAAVEVWFTLSELSRRIYTCFASDYLLTCSSSQHCITPRPNNTIHCRQVMLFFFLMVHMASAVPAESLTNIFTGLRNKINFSKNSLGMMSWLVSSKAGPDML